MPRCRRTSTAHEQECAELETTRRADAGFKSRWTPQIVRADVPIVETTLEPKQGCWRKELKKEDHHECSTLFRQLAQVVFRPSLNSANGAGAGGPGRGWDGFDWGDDAIRLTPLNDPSAISETKLASSATLVAQHHMRIVNEGASPPLCPVLRYAVHVWLSHGFCDQQHSVVLGMDDGCGGAYPRSTLASRGRRCEGDVRL